MKYFSDSLLAFPKIPIIEFNFHMEEEVMIQSLLSEAKSLQPELVTLRRKLHEVPELGLDLPKTQGLVLEALKDLGLEITTGRGLSSVVAVVHGRATGHTVLLRGDMDGLPVREQTGLPFASTNGNMQACGHDLHISGLVGAARLLAAHRQELDGDVVLMFQPGEEGDSGAQVMLDEGLLDAASSKVEAAYGIHVWSSMPKGQFFTKPGALMASSNNMKITVHGRGGHGSAPSTTLDPVPVAAEIVGALQTFVTRHMDIFDPIIVSVTRLSAGIPINAVPDNATLEATIRTLSKESWDKLCKGIPQLASSIAEAYGCTAETELSPLYPVTVNAADEAAFVLKTLNQTFGEDRVVTMSHAVMGAEDFSFVLNKVPGTFILLGACVDETTPEEAASNHSPLARFDDSVLADEASALAVIAEQKLAQLSA